MIRTALAALFGLWAFVGPVYAAEPAPANDHAMDDEATATEPTGPTLPTSMLRHGVAGYVPPPEGIAILDPAILAAMRERLIMYVPEKSQ